MSYIPVEESGSFESDDPVDTTWSLGEEGVLAHVNSCVCLVVTCIVTSNDETVEVNVAGECTITFGLSSGATPTVSTAVLLSSWTPSNIR